MSGKKVRAVEGPILAQPTVAASELSGPAQDAEWLTWSLEEAAGILGISLSAAYNYAKDGTLPTIRFGAGRSGRILVPKAALDRLLALA